MFRVFDFDALAMDMNTVYGIQWRDNNGMVHAIDDDKFFDSYMSEVAEIIFLSNYHDSGKTQIIYTIIPNTNVNYSAHINPIPLQDFRQVMRCIPGQSPIKVEYDVSCDDNNVFIAGFKIIPANDRSLPPTVKVKTAETIVQPF